MSDEIFDFFEFSDSESENSESAEPRKRVCVHNYCETTVQDYSDKEFIRAFRLNRDQVNSLIQEYSESEYYKKSEKDQGREGILPHKHIYIFLYFVGHQIATYRELLDKFDVSLSALFKIITRVSKFIGSIADRYIRWPTAAEMEETKHYYEENFNIPNVFGNIDGTHVQKDRPKDSADSYYNRKDYFSLQVQILCDQNLKILDFIAGYPGSVHDARVFKNSPLFERFNTENIVSSESEQQQQQQTGASHSAISEVPVAASNDTSPSSSRVAPTSEVGSSEEADDDNEEDDDDGTDNDEDDDEQEEDGEEEETSAEVEEEEDEYEDELRAVANDKAGELSQRGDDLSSELLRLGDKEVRALIEYGRRKKANTKPTVKKELGSSSLHPDDTNDSSGASHHEFQEGERSYESYEQQQQPVYEVVRPVPGRSRRRIRRRLDKRQAELVEGLRSYLLDEYNKERLGDEEGKGLYAESLLKLLSKLSENPQRWERVHQLLNDLKANLEYSRRGLDTQKRLVYPTRATSTTSRPDRTTRRPKWKKKKKKKKKPKQHKLKSSTTTTTTTTSAPIPTVMGLATTETPWATTRPPSWRLVADRLFNPPWDQGNLRLDDTDIAKVRYSMPSKPRTVAGKNEDDGLEALNSEREALMLEAAREYSQPRPLHYGKINTHLRTSSGEDMDDAYSDRSHQRRPVHYGQLIPEAGSSRLDYPRNSFGSSLARNLEDLLPQRNQPKTWKQNGYRLHKPKNSWKWQGYPDPQSRPWLPWERDYFENADEDEGNSWEQQRQRAEWNRQSLRENFPPWLEEKEIQRVLQTTWSQPDKSREDPDRGNSFEQRNNYDYKPEDDSKESPKLTMKTWDSLTSDPATWPFKLPGAKPWPKDENGKSYNPNADLVRKLGLYSKNGRLRAEKEKQQKLQKHEKSNTWLEPDEQQSAWFNSLKQGYQDPERNRWNNETPSVSNEGSASKAQATSGSNNNWPGNNKWNKQFAYHKVTAQPTSKSSVDKPGGKNAFIAVSAVSGPKYGNEWSSNDIEEMGNDGEGKPVDPNDPSSQMRMNKWKKSLGTNGSIPGDVDGSPKTDVLENQLEGLKKKDEPVLLEVNVSIKNSTVHSIPPSSVALAVEKTTAENNSTKTEQH